MMTKEEAIKWLRDIANDPLTIDPEADAISMAIKALKQPECEDAVSRFKVLQLIDYSSNDLNDSVDNRCFQNQIKELPSVTPKQQRWIYIEEELPKTIINTHTHDYQEYICLCDFGDNGFDVRTYKFGYGHFWNGGGIVDKYVTAWQSLPEIPDTLRQKPLEGGQDGKAD